MNIHITIIRQMIFPDGVVFRLFEIMYPMGTQWQTQKQHGHNSNGAGMGWIQHECTFGDSKLAAMEYWEKLTNAYQIEFARNTNEVTP